MLRNLDVLRHHVNISLVPIHHRLGVVPFKHGLHLLKVERLDGFQLLIDGLKVILLSDDLRHELFDHSVLGIVSLQVLLVVYLVLDDMDLFAVEIDTSQGAAVVVTAKLGLVDSLEGPLVQVYVALYVRTDLEALVLHSGGLCLLLVEVHVGPGLAVLELG